MKSQFCQSTLKQLSIKEPMIKPIIQQRRHQNICEFVIIWFVRSLRPQNYRYTLINVEWEGTRWQDASPLIEFRPNADHFLIDRIYFSPHYFICLLQCLPGSKCKSEEYFPRRSFSAAANHPSCPSLKEDTDMESQIRKQRWWLIFGKLWEEISTLAGLYVCYMINQTHRVRL